MASLPAHALTVAAADRTRVLVAVSEPDVQAQVVAALTAGDRFSVLECEADQEAVLVELSLRREIGAVILDGDMGREVAPTFARSVGTIVVARRPSADDLRLALSARVIDVLEPPLSQGKLEETVSEAMARTRGSAVTTGTVVLVKAAKGGSGATTVAVQLGARLRKRGASVCLVELGPPQGGVASLVDVAGGPGRSLADVLGAGDLADQQLLDALTTDATGAAFIPGPAHLDASSVEGRPLSRLLWRLRTLFDVVVVDAGTTTGPLFRAASNMADRSFVVVTPDWQCLGAAADIARRWHAGELQLSSPVLLLNKADASDEVQPRAIAKRLGFPSGTTVLPHCYTELQKAAAAKAPANLVDRDWTAAMDSVVTVVTAGSTEVPPKGGG